MTILSQKSAAVAMIVLIGYLLGTSYVRLRETNRHNIAMEAIAREDIAAHKRLAEACLNKAQQ